MLVEFWPVMLTDIDYWKRVLKMKVGRYDRKSAVCSSVWVFKDIFPYSNIKSYLNSWSPVNYP